MPASLLFLLAVQSPTVRITWDETKKKTSWYESVCRTPKFSGAGKLGTFAGKTIRDQALKEIKTLVGESKPESTPENPYAFDWVTTVSVAKPSLISTYSEFYTYAGGAHPNRSFDAHTFAMVGGKPKQLKFSDLMRTKIAPKAVVTGVVIPRLKQMEASWVVDGEMTEVPDNIVDRFVVTPAGLTWIFAPYDAGPYVQGEFFVKVPWADLAPHLNPNGPLKGIMPTAKN